MRGMLDRVMARQPVRALCAQVLGLVTAFLIGGLFPGALQGMWRFAFAQGLAAAIWARLLRQSSWWLPMHMVFLPALFAALTLELPTELYLAAFLLCVLVFWKTVQGDVPLFLSSAAVTETVGDIVDDERAWHFVDLGAGIGSVAVPLAQRFPLLKVEAWERAPLPWLIARWRGRALANLTVRRQSLWECDLSRFDVVFAFLSPLPMPELGEKARREMRSGALLVSSSFPVPEWQPEQVIEVRDGRATKLYCYRMTEQA